MNENTVYGRANVGMKPYQPSGLYGCWYGARKRQWCHSVWWCTADLGRTAHGGGSRRAFWAWE
eukprot:1180662-Prorocentrum_minimum.AAC.6